MWRRCATWIAGDRGAQLNWRKEVHNVCLIHNVRCTSCTCEEGSVQLQDRKKDVWSPVTESWNEAFASWKIWMGSLIWEPAVIASKRPGVLSGGILVNAGRRAQPKSITWHTIEVCHKTVALHIKQVHQLFIKFLLSSLGILTFSKPSKGFYYTSKHLQTYKMLAKIIKYKGLRH